jgi:hemolysin III
MVMAAPPPRPMLRGWFHLVAALAAPAGLVALMLIADSPRDYVAASIYAPAVIVLYATSAGYHLVPWPSRARSVMARLDHSMIFVLIAATYTPFCLKVLNDAWGITMLAVVWALAGAGVLLKLFWPTAPRWLSVALYLAVGWVALIPAMEVIQNLEAAAIGLLLLGGLLYSAGALIYGARRPDPFPRFFGYHEVFHVLVIAGSLVHFSVIAAYVLPA